MTTTTTRCTNACADGRCDLCCMCRRRCLCTTTGRQDVHARGVDPSGEEVWQEVRAERMRAHAKHGASSMETLPAHDLTRLSVLIEEVGEVAKVLNDARHRGARLGWDPADGISGEEKRELRAELIQVAAMAGAWADAL